MAEPTHPSPLEVVGAIYDAFARKDLEAVLRLTSPDIVMTQDPALPWGGRYEGHDGLGEFILALLGSIDSAAMLEALATPGALPDAVLHASALEADLVAEVQPPGVTFGTRHVDANGIEVIPTPGHTPGSTCYLLTGHDDLTYLFTGDTIFRGADGTWRAGYIPGFSDRDALAGTLDLLAALAPDLVASSACAGDDGAHLLDQPWADCVAEALAAL